MRHVNDHLGRFLDLRGETPEEEWELNGSKPTGDGELH